MPLKFAASVVAPAPLSLTQFLDAMQGRAAPTSSADMLSFYPLFQQLNANKTFLGDFFAKLLGAPEGTEKGGYNYQTVVIASGAFFVLRANLWMPGMLPGTVDHDNYGYGIAHNHNFGLLTIGYFGDAYETQMYTLQDPLALRNVGDDVVLDDLGVWKLAVDEGIFYEIYQDVHIQKPTSHMFVTLNLVFKPPRDEYLQFVFDPALRSIKQILGSPIDARVLAMAFSERVLGCGAETLSEWVSNDPSVRVRAGARQALLDLHAFQAPVG